VMDVFNSKNYRTIIKTWIGNQPKNGHGQLTKLAGVLSVPTSVMSLVLSGTRDLNPDQSYLVAEYMSLSQAATEYFVTLVLHERASNFKYRAFLEKRLKELKQQSLIVSKRVTKDTALSKEDQYIFYSSWAFSVVRLKSSLGSGITLAALKTELNISTVRLTGIVEFLLSRGLVIQEKNVFRVGPQITWLDHRSPMISQHHTNWRAKAIERAGEITEEELMLTAPFSCRAEDFAIIREKIVKLMTEMSEIVKKTEAPDTVAYFGADLFKV
ncbi:MAG: TIGR02147 family protein, partial [Proteobacteria bacterium]